MAARTAPALTLSLDRARRAFLAAQGLAGEPGAGLLPTLERTGFVRTMGGVDVYLAARARVPGLSRADLDGAVERGEVQVVPAVRGCMYLVPRRHVAVCLRVADLLSRGRDEREHQKAGIRPGEVEEVAQAVLAALGAKGPLTTDAVRRALPEGTVRSLGEAGKKIGISSPLPPALRLLEFQGKVERTSENGRLDTERYLWRAAKQSPFEGVRLPEEPIALYALLAELFFRAAGLGTVKDFAAWAGISRRDAKAACERLDLLPVTVEGVEEEHRALAEAQEALAAEDGSGRGLALLPFEDNVVALHGGAALLVDAAHLGTEVPAWGHTKGSTLGDARYMSFRSIVAEGRLRGFWEYDPGSREVALAVFDPVSAATRRKVESAAVETARFLAGELGHGKSYSIDTDEDLARRAGQIRDLAAR